MLIGFAVCAFTALVACSLTRIRLLRRIRALGQELNQITSSADGSRRVKLRSGGAIGELAEAINRSLTAIEGSSQQLRSLERQLSQSSKLEALGRLASGIAHDFNNLLTAINGFAQLARRETRDNPNAYQSLREVLTATNRAKKLVDQILQFARQREPQREPINIRIIIEEVIRLLRPSIPQNIEFSSEFSGTNLFIIADGAQMHQVLLNLCVNAIDAMRDRGGRLKIKLSNRMSRTTNKGEKPIEQIHLAVIDSGVGIPPSEIVRIFDPFYTTKEPGKGTGMGLAIVNKVIRDHAGSIEVESALYQGTTFDIYLPTTQQRPSANELLELSGSRMRPKALSTEEAERRGKTHILFVDDEESLVRLAKEMISSSGYQVTTCAHPGEAIAHFVANPERFDLVITDQSLPAMSGDELKMRLRQTRPDLPVVLCSGGGEDIDNDDQQRVLKKPFDLVELDSAIESALRK